MSDWTPERIRNLRRRMGMTQLELGEYLGYGTGAQVRISEMERGEKGVSGPVSRLLDLLEEKANSEK